MKLVLIYGPPAVGKLSVAQALAALTGFKLFHNHVTVDLVTSIFERGSPSFAKLVWEIRLPIFREAAQVGIDGLIFTMVYTQSRIAKINEVVNIVERYGGDVCLVHLYCDKETLEKRVVSENRKQYGKIVTVEQLNETLDQLKAGQPFSTIPDRDSLSLDTSILQPHEAALEIATHCKLPGPSCFVR